MIKCVKQRSHVWMTLGLILLSGVNTLPAYGENSSPSTECPRAVARIGGIPMICADRDNFSKQAKQSGLQFSQSAQDKELYRSDALFPLPAKMIAVYNESKDLVIAQFIFPANDSKNSYKKIRLYIREQYGVAQRVAGYERSPQFEYKWKLKDGVAISFFKRAGQSQARLMYSVSHKARAYMANH